MRIGVFGGTFDPVHLGHLIVAEHCREHARLDRVLFIPAWKPPHKLDRELTPFHHRVEMLHLAVAGNPAFQIDELERERPGPSYTVDTLEALHVRHPQDELFLILGADCLPDLPHWREPARIVAQASLLVASRPGWSLWSAEQIREALRLPSEVPLRVEIVQVPWIDDASRDLRRRVAERRSLRYLVPRAVECYIQTHHLYQPAGNPASP
jgi:nicotinate-nucleotide adenylyltransferase